MRLRMMAVGLPRGTIAIVRLMTPDRPAGPRSARKQLKMRTGRTGFDYRILLVRLARMLTLSRRKKIDLPTSRLQRARILAFHTKQQNLCHITEIKSDSAAIRSAILADFVPDDVGFVE